MLRNVKDLRGYAYAQPTGSSAKWKTSILMMKTGDPLSRG